MRFRRKPAPRTVWRVAEAPGTQLADVPTTGAVASHFTSAANWERIQQEGLLPYPQKDPELVAYFPYGVLAWPRMLDLDSVIGSVLWQATRKGTEAVVGLAIEYYPDDLMPPSPLLRGRDSITLTHNGTYIDGTPFHVREPFIILKAIPPERASLVASYFVPQEGWS